MADNAALFAQFEKMMMKKLAAQHKRTDAALAANQSQLASQASTIASLTNKVGSLEKQLATTKFELATTKSELEDTLSSTQDYVDGFRDYVEERSDRLDDVQEQVSASHDTLVIVQNSLHQADLRADAHESTLGQIAKRLDPFGQWRHLTRTGLGAVGKVWTWYVVRPPVFSLSDSSRASTSSADRASALVVISTGPRSPSQQRHDQRVDSLTCPSSWSTWSPISRTKKTGLTSRKSSARGSR